MDEVTIKLSVKEVDFIIQVLGALPTIQTAQHDMLHLIPTIREQAQNSLKGEPHFSG